MPPCRLGGLAVVFLPLLVAGCSSKPNNVSGQVTIGKTQLATNATITFLGTDGKTYPVPLSPAGRYSLENPPLGEVRVTVVATTYAMETARPETPHRLPQAIPSIPFIAPPQQQAAIPQRYSKPDSGLTISIKPGQSIIDIDLEP